MQMENELQRFHNQNLQLELNIDELRQKLKAAEREILQERQKVRFFLCPKVFLRNLLSEVNLHYFSVESKRGHTGISVQTMVLILQSK